MGDALQETAARVCADTSVCAAIRAARRPDQRFVSPGTSVMIAPQVLLSVGIGDRRESPVCLTRVCGWR
jgi:hypothetical protein